MRSLSLILSLVLAGLPLCRCRVLADDSRSRSLADLQNMRVSNGHAQQGFEGSDQRANYVYAGEGGKFTAAFTPAPRAEGTGTTPGPKGPPAAPPTTHRPGVGGANEPPAPGPGSSQGPAAPKADDGKQKAEGGGDKGNGIGLDNPAIGAAIGLLAGAAIGFAVGGPIGACVGICVGALVGALISAMIKSAKGGGGGGDDKK